MGCEREELKRRLAAGESLEVFTGGGSYEVWAEPYANPPAVFYEGRVFPYAELENVIDAILMALWRGDVTCQWVESRGMQADACEQAYRARSADNPEERP